MFRRFKVDTTRDSISSKAQTFREFRMFRTPCPDVPKLIYITSQRRTLE
uniref:Uncharacterized protein n=1 Tax=Arundo donax TaxID=35708 RepID=A0A0A9BJC4_ARUDO